VIELSKEQKEESEKLRIVPLHAILAIDVLDVKPHEGKDEEKDEEVIDRQGELNEIAGDELQPALCVLIPKDDTCEDNGEGDPDSAPDRSLSVRNCVGFTIEKAEVEAQHEKNEQAKTHP